MCDQKESITLHWQEKILVVMLVRVLLHVPP